MKRSSSFVAITTEGGLLPADFLVELLSPKADIDGLTPTSYNLADGERISEQVNRSWNRLKGRWADFKKAMAEKSADEFITTETRNRWLQPLFQELGYGQRLSRAKPIEIDGKSYPVSHAWNDVPMHLVGAHIDLDHRTPGAVGAAKLSPHSLVQQLLNASDEHLWGIVSNGLSLRLLRDNIALTRQALVEWDLAAIFDGELYSEFFLLWLVVHQSRFDAELPEQCWLEQWKKKAEDKGLRALDKLRLGVTRAIEALGEGLLSHPRNKALQSKLSKGELTSQDFYRQVLRIIYRILFLLVAEHRELLHTPLPNDQDKDTVDQQLRARQRYRDFYSVGRLRHLTLVRAGTPHSDLWQTFQFITKKLGSNEGCPELALPALGSFLWDTSRSTRDLNDALISNHRLITAVHALTFVQDGSIRRFVDYKNLASEELGSVYEGLLGLHPIIDPELSTFKLDTVVGNERKTSGSYYTPESLVQCLPDSALDPVIADTVQGKQGAQAVHAVLNLKICDPAAGSGHFLIAAAHRLAKHVAIARSGEDEPSPAATRTALRDVIGRCIYGVDINPMAVELCKVSLWMETVDPGKPLSFLDHHIQCGNSLLGTTPALMSNGIPDEAFKPIEGDDPKLCAEYRKQNKRERQQDTLLGFHGESWEHVGNLATDITKIASMPDDRLEEVQSKEQKYAALIRSIDYEFEKLVADSWCAAFVWKKCPTSVGSFEYPITNEIFRQLECTKTAPTWMLDEIKRLAQQYQFFHWHLAFPEIFQGPPARKLPLSEIGGWNGGFDVNLGNPPWERVKLQEKEWFAQRRPHIASAPTAAARKRLIESLKIEDAALHRSFMEDSRKAEGESQLLRNSRLYPLCGRGDINLYGVFAECMRNHIGQAGRIGSVLPTGIVTDESNKFFVQQLVGSKSIVSFFDFTNRGYIFPGTESTLSFCLLTVSNRPQESFRIAAQLWQVSNLAEEGRAYSLTQSDILRINPNTQNLPIFRSIKDAELNKEIYERFPILIQETPVEVNRWECSFDRMFDMTNDSALFRTRRQLLEQDFTLIDSSFYHHADYFLPLYEAKLAGMFNHRAATFDGIPESEMFGTRAGTVKPTDADLSNPYWPVISRYWVSQREVLSRVPPSWKHSWLAGFRNAISAVADARSVSFTVFPRWGAGNSLPVIFIRTVEAPPWLLIANFNSFVLDYVAKQKASGGNLNFYIVKQLPLLAPTAYAQPCDWADQGQTRQAWLRPRVLELTYTAWDLEGFAQDCGWSGPPFRWNEKRRFLLRCELDAAFFHFYGLGREQAAHILDTFPIVRRKDEEKYNGDYRTKRVTLEIYDEMAQAIATGAFYQTRLDPPPADPRVAHEPRVTAQVSVPSESVTSCSAISPPEVFRRIRPRRDERYVKCVPLIDLKIAAGEFSEEQSPQLGEWVQINSSRKLRKGMFVAQVVGSSMQPLIPNGSYCLFRRTAPQVRNELIGLFQLHNTEDPELGGHYTVKRLKVSMEKTPDNDFWRTTTLVPENPSFQTITVDSNEVTFVAEFLEVLKPLEDGPFNSTN